MSHIENMQAAWYEQCMKSGKELQHLDTGYALFKPEYAKEIRERAEHAKEQYFFWLGQS